MNLKEYKDYFKATFPWTEAISIGKIDNNQEKAICFYNSNRGLPPIKSVDMSSYNIKPITILLRYTKNQDTAETMANSIYEFLDERIFKVNKKQVIAQLVYSEPINLGTDDNGVYEYSFEINFIEER